MNALSSCPRCHGFVPSPSTECLHCGAPLPAPASQTGDAMKALLGLAGAGVAAITLMACYGMPPCDTPAPDGGSDRYHCYRTPEDGDGGLSGGDAGSDAGR